jgi:hypothetical protein
MQDALVRSIARIEVVMMHIQCGLFSRLRMLMILSILYYSWDDLGWTMKILMNRESLVGGQSREESR